MDEINEKAIKDIIDYYDRIKEVHEEEPSGEHSEEKPNDKKPVSERDLEEENIPNLVELIEETYKEEASADDIPKQAQTASDSDEEEDSEAKAKIETEEDNVKTAAGNEEESAETGEEDKILTEAAETEEISETTNAETKENSEADDAETEEFSETTDAETKENSETAEAETEADNQPETDEKNVHPEQEESKKIIPISITPVYDLSELEDEEEEYHLNKKQIWTILIVTLLIAAFVAVIVTVDTGFIGSYKQNASKNITALLAKAGIEISSDDTKTKEGDVKTAGSYKTSAKNTVTIPMETAGKSVFAGYRNGIVCAYTNYLTFISSDGAAVWENTTTIVDPILKTAGNYILIAEKSGKKICLYNDSKLIFEADTEDNILMCNLSSNGDVVAVTDKSSYKGAIVVFNREGNQIFAWSSGSDNVISADISAASRRVAVALLNTDDKVKSTIQLFDMKETESYAQAIFEDTILFDIDFTGDTVSAFGDNCIAGLTSDCRLIYDKRFDNADFIHYGADAEGNKILLFDDANIPLINIYNSKAVLKYQLSSDEIPDFVDICGKYIVFNSGRDIVYGKSGKRQLEKYTASMDIKELLMLDEETFVIVYSNNIEIVRM